MAVPSYRVYSNGGNGGPVNYSTPLQNSTSTTFAMAGIAPGNWAFAVRAYDPSTGLEEQNTDATVSVVIGTDHLDHTAIPNSPVGLTARPSAGGVCLLDFFYIAVGQGGPPTSFEAWLWTAGSINWSASPTATLSTTFGRGGSHQHYSMSLTGLSDGVAYAVGVRAINAAGSDGNTATVPVTGSVTGPPAVSGLTAAAGYPSAG